jgi:hypothetical protein
MLVLSMKDVLIMKDLYDVIIQKVPVKEVTVNTTAQ